MTLLKVHEGEGLPYRPGTDVLDEIADFILERLPEMHPTDQVRISLAKVMPTLCRQLGRPSVAAVER